jgi:hypothetical protein
MAKFNRTTALRNVQAQPLRQVAPKAAPSPMTNSFPGVKCLTAKVTKFVKSNECHIDLVAQMGNAKVTAEVGRLDPTSTFGRLDFGSVQAWAQANNLVYSHEDPAVTSSNGEEYVVIYLIAAEAVKKSW